MYGYIRPYKPDLRIREWETYKGVYCALCSTLKTRSGFAARFAVNYDLTFLTMLMAKPGESPRFEALRCPADLRKKPHCFAEGAVELAADLSVIMAYHKLRDSLEDDALARKVFVAAPALAILGSKYRKCEAVHEKFANTAKKRLDELAEMEHNRGECASECAMKFAAILSAMGEYCGEPRNRRIVCALLQNIGQIIYLLDAYDDMERDVKRGGFNPLVGSAELPAIRETLERAARAAAADFELLEPNAFRPILENIFYLGIHSTIDKVLSKRMTGAK
ncbi:MAG: DUF5685 family protein [Oscillospiraceae bacterium]|jgi:hypothetical protein|nr:DUF5685 family protein [Oscillospiraceae bacterium]